MAVAGITTLTLGDGAWQLLNAGLLSLETLANLLCREDRTVPEELVWWLSSKGMPSGACEECEILWIRCSSNL